MSEPSLVKLRLSSEARNLDEKRELHRKKSAIVLILHHLEKNGYIQASKWLEQESGITTANYTPADNVDLLYILQEFEDYQRIKYNRNFKLIRNAAVPSNASYPKPLPAFSAPPSITKNIVSKDLMKKDEALKPRKLHPIQQAYQKLAQDSLQSKESEKPSEINDIPPLELQGTSMPFSTISPAVTSKEISTESAKVMSDSDETLHVPNPLKSSIYPLNTEYRDLSSMILQEIIQKSPNISFESIQGLEKAKKIIKEALIFPTQFPELRLFHPLYLFSPWKGILLYGPPGTGKTTLAKAIATECGTTFFHVSASSIVSKWRGESEKLVRVLFELARHHAPSTIFIDEVESLLSQRTGGENGDHEGSKRMKSELLMQLDGLSNNESEESPRVFFLAATNMPWELDIALLRRLEKRVFINVPTEETRKCMLSKFLPHNAKDTFGQPLVGSLDFSILASLTEGFSGADLRLIAKEALMIPLRRILKQLEEGSNLQHYNRDPVTMEDVRTAILSSKPTIDQRWTKKYADWEEQFGNS